MDHFQPVDFWASVQVVFSQDKKDVFSFVLQQKGIEIWARPIMPVLKGKYSYAIVFLNRRTDGTPSEVSISSSNSKHFFFQ